LLQLIKNYREVEAKKKEEDPEELELIEKKSKFIFITKIRENIPICSDSLEDLYLINTLKPDEISDLKGRIAKESKTASKE
jgi:hypothetical protein